jgi:Fic family protein
MENAWEDWIIFVLRGIKQTAEQTRSCIIQIQHLMQKTAQLIKEELPKIYSKELVEVIFQQPYCKIRFLEEARIAKRQTASLYLKELERIGVLKSTKIGQEVYYVNSALYKILTQK